MRHDGKRCQGSGLHLDYSQHHVHVFNPRRREDKARKVERVVRVICPECKQFIGLTAGDTIREHLDLRVL